MDGILITNKPKGITSFGMCSKIRKEYNEKKVGHIGTLDPEASGVLPILIGKATKLSDLLMEHDKEYIVEIKLGIKTETGDSEGKVLEETEVSNDINQEQIENVLKSFLGSRKQVPPMYSALKVNGQKLYELARQGKTIERKPRDIYIDSIELINFNKEENIIKYKVNCSKGTYMRVLSEDIALKLGTIGYMLSLVRTRVGAYKLEHEGKFIELENILDLKKIVLSNDLLKKILNGQKIKTENKDGLVKIYSNNKFIGIGEVKNNLLKRKIII